MLINQLPQDFTPQSNGMIPYSEDGVHLNFITIESIMGYGGGDGGGGGGGLTSIEFPDGTIGYYSSTEPTLIGYDELLLNRGLIGSPKINPSYKFIIDKIRTHPERYFSAYIATRSASEQISFYNAPGNELRPNGCLEINIVSHINSTSNFVEPYTIGYYVDNNNYNDQIGQNFPFFLFSSKQTVVNTEGRKYEKKLPILHMFYNKDIAERIVHTYRFDPGYSDARIGELLTVPWDKIGDVVEHKYMPSLNPYAYFGANDGTGEATAFNFYVDYSSNGTKTELTMPSIIPIQHMRTPSPISAEGLNAFMNARWDEDIYEINNEIPIHFQLWDIWKHSVYGVFCYHIISHLGEEYYLFFEGETEHDDLIVDNKLASAIWNPSESNTTSTYLNGRPIRKILTPWVFEDPELDGDIYLGQEPTEEVKNHIRKFRSKNQGMEFVVSHILKLDIIEGPASFMIGSKGGFAGIVPLRRKLIWDWYAQTNTQYGLIQKDYMYGTEEVIKESLIGLQGKYTNLTTKPISAATFGQGITFGNFTSIGYGIDDNDNVDHIIEGGSSVDVIWATLNYIARGGGGGSSLPYVTDADAGKVLTVDGNGEWNDLYPAPFKIAGQTDSHTAIEVENYLSVRNGIRADKVNGVASIYADPSVMHIGDYIDIVSAKSGGFTASKNEDSNTGVTSISLDIADIDKFMQIAPGSGIQVSKTMGGNNVRTYTISGTPLSINLSEAYKNHMHILDSAWTTLNANQGGGSYHPSQSLFFDPNNSYYIDASISFEVPANIAPGSYARFILSPSTDDGTVFYSNQGEIGGVGRTSVFEDTKLLIPGVVNTLRISGMFNLSVSKYLYLNMFHNAGVPLGYDTANPGSPASTLGIKVTGFYFKF